MSMKNPRDARTPSHLRNDNHGTARERPFTRCLILLLSVLASSHALYAVELTHGPMIGHTTDASALVWVRASGPCSLSIQARRVNGGAAGTSNKVSLTEDDNFCGEALLTGLSPKTAYGYQVLLDGVPQAPAVRQEFTTFPPPGDPGIVRIGFGHSLPKGTPSPQKIWATAAAKNPDLFILMGDNIYSNTTDPEKQRPMYLEFRADPLFRSFAATTPIYAIWDDHDYGVNNSDRTQPGKESSLKTFNEIWANPPPEAVRTPGIWTRFSVGPCDFFLLDVRYHRSPDDDPDGPDKTMLGAEQRAWLLDALDESTAPFKFPVSGSSWNCGGVEAWNHRYTYEYDLLTAWMAKRRITGCILLGGDQHHCKIGVRPGESWGGYDLREWMAAQLWNSDPKAEGTTRGFGMITVDATASPPTASLEFFNPDTGDPQTGRRILYTTPGSLRALWDSPKGTSGPTPPRSADGELRPLTSGPLYESLPATTGETVSLDDLRWQD